MPKKDVKLNEDLNNVRFNVQTADIIVYPEDVREPLIRYSGEFDVNQRHSEATITEKSNNSSMNITSFGRKTTQ